MNDETQKRVAAGKIVAADAQVKVLFEESDMRLHGKALQVKCRDDLASFLDDLCANLRQHRAEWENATLEDYLEAAAAWVRDMDGYFERQNREPPRDPDWSLIAQIFLAAKTYE